MYYGCFSNNVDIRSFQRWVSFAKTAKCEPFIVTWWHLQSFTLRYGKGEGLNNDIIFFGMQGWYCDIKFRPLFSVNTLKVPERYFHFRSRNMRNDKSELETFQKNCPRLKLSELFSKQLLFKECSVTNHCHKKLDFFLTKKGFKTNLF